MNVNVSFYTAQGARDKNEDAVSLVENDGTVFAIVADGLGGHSNGEIASKQAVDILNRLVQQEQPDEDFLIDAIQNASCEIYAKQIPGSFMYTTIAALWMQENQAIVANVGDSRIYQFRNGTITYQSLDHSVAQMAALVGKLDPNNIRHSKDRNKLIRVLGAKDAPKVDCKTLDVQSGDCFLLCTDGFWETVTEEKMQDTLNESISSEQWLNRMFQALTDIDNPAQDNHSAIVLFVE